MDCTFWSKPNDRPRKARLPHHAYEPRIQYQVKPTHPSTRNIVRLALVLLMKWHTSFLSLRSTTLCSFHRMTFLVQDKVCVIISDPYGLVSLFTFLSVSCVLERYLLAIEDKIMSSPNAVDTLVTEHYQLLDEWTAEDQSESRSPLANAKFCEWLKKSVRTRILWMCHLLISNSFVRQILVTVLS